MLALIHAPIGASRLAVSIFTLLRETYAVFESGVMFQSPKTYPIDGISHGDTRQTLLTGARHAGSHTRADWSFAPSGFNIYSFARDLRGFRVRRHVSITQNVPDRWHLAWRHAPNTPDRCQTCWLSYTRRLELRA